MNNIKRAQIRVRDLITNDIDTNPAFQHQGNFLKRHMSMKDVMTYSLKTGKRLRPIIADSIGQWRNNYFPLFIEYVHNSSLIVDDLPCMDDDQIRREQETVHIKYGEYTAQLTAYNLMITAMSHLTEGCEQIRHLYSDEDYIKLRRIVNQEATEQLGFPGLCGGQMIDILLAREGIQNMSQREQRETIIDMIRTKTGCLFSLSFALGWISNGGAVQCIHNIKDIGYDFGMCYQIIDDLRDVEKDTQKNGGANNICKYYSRNELIDLFTGINLRIVHACDHFNLWNPVIRELNNYLIKSFQKALQDWSHT